MRYTIARTTLLSIYFFCLTLFSQAQAPMPAMHSGQLQHELFKMQVVGTVLYIAAHPDDENTRLISYLVGEKGYRVAYLSLTRGDGGQNLIGDEKGPYLGILRTQELLAARRVDGGEQMFSRAIDFGYSKNPEETLEIWDRDKVLADVVWAMRKLRPDVIVARFATPERGGGGHGHHTSSAILAKEALELAGREDVYPEQLKYVSTWEPKRVLWNTYSWRRYEPSEEDKDLIFSFDVDTYNPFLGKSYGEISAEARSMHKCQAFGTARYRGEQYENLLFVNGQLGKGDLMDGVNTTWSRIPNADKIAKPLKDAFENFDSRNPSLIVPHLLQAYKEMEGRTEPEIIYKRKKLAELIVRCSGLYFEINSAEATAARGDSIELTASVIKRLDFPVSLKSISFDRNGPTQLVNESLDDNKTLYKYQQKLSLEDKEISQPYWLKNEPAKGVFDVTDQELIGLPENPPALEGSFTFAIGENQQELTIKAPVVYKYVDRAIGELYRPFLITPQVTVNVAEKVYLFSNNDAQTVSLVAKAHKKNTKATLTFDLPNGWKANPSEIILEFAVKGEEKNLEIQVIPPSKSSQGKFIPQVNIEGKSSSHSLDIIQYDHIPTQMVFNKASANLVRVEIEKKGQRIGYIMGSGDEVPASLRQIGYEVDLLADEDISLRKLQSYDAIISGIRTYNTRERIPFHHDVLMDYVKEGGVYVVQYNTSRGLKTSKIGPYPGQISRDRITVEEAPLKILNPDHPIFNTPNKITEDDFEGWVQERGLYFWGGWDEKYEPLLEGNDPGEDPKRGALLVSQYGEGHYVYCALSMFRELPAGVPGAYRLFANMISLGK